MTQIAAANKKDLEQKMKIIQVWLPFDLAVFSWAVWSCKVGRKIGSDAMQILCINYQSLVYNDFGIYLHKE